jgi:hypothetical protein
MNNNSHSPGSFRDNTNDGDGNGGGGQQPKGHSAISTAALRRNHAVLELGGWLTGWGF